MILTDKISLVYIKLGVLGDYNIYAKERVLVVILQTYLLRIRGCQDVKWRERDAKRADTGLSV